MRVVTLGRSLDEKLITAGRMDDTSPSAALGTEGTKHLVRAVASAVGSLLEAGHPPVVVTSAEARPVLKDLTRVDLPRLVVIAQREIPRDTPVESLGVISEEELPIVTSVDAGVGVV